MPIIPALFTAENNGVIITADSKKVKHSGKQTKITVFSDRVEAIKLF